MLKNGLIKSYLINVSTDLESMYDELREREFQWTTLRADDNQIEIAFVLYNPMRLWELSKIMKWYI